jgi:hypothetical protein
VIDERRRCVPETDTPARAEVVRDPRDREPPERRDRDVRDVDACDPRRRSGPSIQCDRQMCASCIASIAPVLPAAMSTSVSGTIPRA